MVITFLSGSKELCVHVSPGANTNTIPGVHNTYSKILTLQTFGVVSQKDYTIIGKYDYNLGLQLDVQRTRNKIIETLVLGMTHVVLTLFSFNALSRHNTSMYHCSPG